MREEAVPYFVSGLALCVVALWSSDDTDSHDSLLRQARDQSSRTVMLLLAV